MTDELNQGIDVFDSLADTDLSSVDTSMPVLAPGVYEFTIKDMSREITKPSEKNPNGGSYVEINLVLAQEAISTKGKVLSPGFPVRHTIWMVATAKYDPREQLASFSDAVVGKTSDGKRPPFDTTFESYKGQTLVASTKVEKERKDPVTGEVYPERTAISRFVARA